MHFYTTKWVGPLQISTFPGVKLNIDFCDVHFYIIKWGDSVHVFTVSLCKVEHRFLRCALLQSKRGTFENGPLHFWPRTHYKVEDQFLRCPFLQSKRDTFENGPLQIYWSVCTKLTFEVILVRKSQAKPPDRPNNPTGGWTGTIYSLETRIRDRDRDRDQQNHSIVEYTNAL